MLRIVNYEEIQGLMLRIASLVDLQEKRDPSFAERVIHWLTALETALNNNRMTAAGQVAALRGLLISAGRGTIPAGLEFHGRFTRRKLQDAAAGFVVREAGNLVSQIIHSDGERIAEADRLGRQLVALAKARGLILQPPQGTNITTMLTAILQAMSADQELSPGIINLEGLVGPRDALIVLDRAITRDLVQA